MTRSSYKHKIYVALFMAVSFALCLTSFTVPKEIAITNGIIKASLYLPDADNGYYRGVRFDWSGIFASLECENHSYYGEWYLVKYKPTNNDAVMGPAEAFDPVGYDAAKAGGTFTKVGVGVLNKPDDSAYKFTRLYTIANPGKWNISVKSDHIIFKQTLNDTSCSYIYQKTVQLVKNKPVMILSHTLKNTGTRTIETSVFDHNFLVMDAQTGGPAFSLTFPFSLNGVPNRRPDYLQMQDNKLTFLKMLDRHPVSAGDLTNGNGSATYEFKVENNVTGAAVRVTADRPIMKIPFWAAPKAICPEPYIKIKVEPGQEFSWTITYTYYTCDTTKQNSKY